MLKKILPGLLIFLFCNLLWSQTHIRINCGGSDVPGGWVSDSGYAAGGSSYTFDAAHDTSGVTNPAPNAVYQRVRHFDHDYHIPVDNGDYLVRIHFTEGHEGSRLLRKMRYTIEGIVVLENYNIFQAAGNVLNKAVIEEFSISVVDGVLTIKCEKAAGNDVFEAGIEIIGQSSPGYNMTVQTIQFNHDPSSDSRDALNLRYNWDYDLHFPEYDYDYDGLDSEPAAYAVDDMDDPVTIKVSFALDTQNPLTLAVRGVSSENGSSGVFGDTNTVDVSFTGGYSELITFNVPFEVWSPVRKAEDDWTWQALVNGTWTDMHTTYHTFYILLDKPRQPWSREYGDKQNPWVTALEFAIDPFYCNADGSYSDETAAGMLTRYLFANSVYDTKDGQEGYLTNLGYGDGITISWEYHKNLDLNAYMYNKMSKVNCYDQAAALETLTALLGIDARVVHASAFGYINETNITGVGPCNNPFFDNEDFVFDPVVWRDETEADGRSYFENHSFVMINDRIFDATAGPSLGEYDLMGYISHVVDSSTPAELSEALICENNLPMGISPGEIKLLYINCGEANLNFYNNEFYEIWFPGKTYCDDGAPVSFPGQHNTANIIDIPVYEEVFRTAQLGSYQQYHILSNDYIRIEKGRYTVYLLFSDDRENTQDARIRVRINGVTDSTLENFSIINEAGGRATALVKEKEIIVTDDNGIIIEVEDLTGQGAIINGIEIWSVSPANEDVYFDRTISLAPESRLYKVTPVQTEHGQIYPANGGVEDSENMHDYMTFSETSIPVPIIAEPEEGYKFAGWISSGPVTIADASSAVTYIRSSGGDAEFSAVFEEDNRLTGDVNANGVVDIIDALMIARYSVGIVVPGFQPQAADVSGDGSVDIIDALMVARYSVGLLDIFPADELRRA